MAGQRCGPHRSTPGTLEPQPQPTLSALSAGGMDRAHVASQRDGILEDRPGIAPACLPSSFLPRPAPPAALWRNIDIVTAQTQILDVLGFSTFQNLRSILVAQQVEYRCQLHIYQWLLLQHSILDADASSTGVHLPSPGRCPLGGQRLLCCRSVVTCTVCMSMLRVRCTLAQPGLIKPFTNWDRLCPQPSALSGIYWRTPWRQPSCATTRAASPECNR